MKDLLSRLIAISAILEMNVPKEDKIVLSWQKLSGLDLTEISDTTNTFIIRQMQASNAIMMRYPIKTFDDYTMLSEADKDKLLRIIKRLRKHLVNLL